MENKLFFLQNTTEIDKAHGLDGNRGKELDANTMREITENGSVLDQGFAESGIRT
jgi:hypothetical protein